MDPDPVDEGRVGMKRQWKCPRCAGMTILPERPRSDVTDLYCLECSAETGKIVKRVCPYLERQKQRRREMAVKQKAARSSRRRDSRAAKAEAVRSKYVRHGVDLREDMQTVWKYAKKIEPKLGRVPVFTIGTRKRWVSGRAWPCGNRIHLSVPKEILHESRVEPEMLVYSARRVLIHEVAHFVAHCRGDSGHGDIFKAAEAELRQELRGVLVFNSQSEWLSGTEVEHG